MSRDWHEATVGRIQVSGVNYKIKCTVWTFRF